MKLNNQKNIIRKLYEEEDYIKMNPLLHAEDSQWKIETLLPFIDLFCKLNKKKTITILDIGGGAGLVLKGISKYITENHFLEVRKYAVDFSKKMLEVQKKNNPDLIECLNGDINKINLRNWEIDIILMIDVLEHINNPKLTLKKLRKISKFIIFKVPLEDNFTLNLFNLLTFGRLRRIIIRKVGHINIYNLSNLKNDISVNCGKIVFSSLSNVHAHLLHSSRSKNLYLLKRIYGFFGLILYKFSPSLSSKVFYDFAIMLVRCDNEN